MNTIKDYWYRATDVVAKWPGAALAAIIVLAIPFVIRLVF